MNPRQLGGRTSLANQDILTISGNSVLDVAGHSIELTLSFATDGILTIQNGTISNPRVGDDNTHISGKAKEVFDILIINSTVSIKVPEINSSGTISSIDGGTF